jgi:translocation and assembly module TamB
MSKLRARLRRFGRFCFFAGLVFALGCMALLWFVTTDSFQQMVRRRLVAAVEHATGGRAEMGSFHVIPFRFQVEVRDLTIHGRESAVEAPYVHVDSVVATVNLSSVLGAKIGFHSLALQHPVVHIIFYPDGSTNRPTLHQQGISTVEELFAFSVDHLEVNRGELLWQERSLPLDFTADDISAGMSYSFLHQRYTGRLAIGKAETQFDGYRPVGWAGDSAFVLDKNGIQVSSLKVASEGLILQARGSVTNLADPVVKASYDLLLDLTQAGAVTRQPQLRAGKLSLKGSGSWSSQSFAASGMFGLRDLALQGEAISAKEVSASGNFSIDPQKILLSKVEGSVWHGGFSSDAEISNWQTPDKPVRNPKDEQKGEVKMRVRGLALSDALASLGPQFSPLTRLQLAGNVSGNSEIKWKQSIRNADATFSAAVERPTRLLAGQVPLTASAEGAYSAKTGELQVSDLQAATPASHLRASGALNASSTLRFSFATTDLNEWWPVLSGLFPAGPPLDVHGRLAFSGNASGKPSDVILAGNLQIEDFDTRATRGGRTETAPWDSLSADVRVSAHTLTLHHAVLQHGAASLSLEGTAALWDWKIFPESQINFSFEIHNADAAETFHLAGYDYGLAGTLDSSGTVSGLIGKPRGHAQVILSHGSIQGHAFDTANAVLDVDGSQATLSDLQVVRQQARISGSGTYGLTARTFQFNLNGTNFDLTEFSPLERSRIAIEGKLDFAAQVSGKASEPQVDADLRLRGVAFNGEVLGDYVLKATSRGADLQVAGHSEFKNANLEVNGNIRLREDWPARIDLRFTRLDVDSLLQSYVRGHVTGHSAVAGSLLLEGPLRRPEQLNVTGSLTDVLLDVEKVKLHNDGPVRFALSNRTLKVETLHILGDATDFSGSGSIQLAGARMIDFQGRGKLDLKLIQTYDPDLTGSGIVSGEAAVSGTVDAPVVKGKLQVENGTLSDVNLPNALTDLNGTLTFSQNRVTIGSLSAHTGGGTVNFTGYADVIGRQINFDVQAQADAVRMRYPPGVSSTSNADLHWRGSSSGSLLSGNITVIKLGVTPGFDFGAYLERSGQSTGLPQSDPVLNNIRLDLHVVTTPELQMQTSVLRLQGEADLRVRGNAAKPVLLGRADVFEGEAYFNGTKYQLERGAVTFGTTVGGNPGSTTPFLDLEATTRVRDYDITLSMSGPADKPKLNYRSEPPLPTSDIIGLLAFGQTTEQSASLQQANQSAFSQQASSAMLTAALNATLNNRTQRLFGGSRIKIDPQGLVTETSPTQSGPAVTIEQQVKDNLTVTYTTNVAQTSQQIIRAEYNVTRNVSVVAIRDQNGVVSFDVKIRRRKR